MAATSHGFNDTRSDSLVSASLTRASDFFASCAGAHLPALRESETDRPFYAAVGAFALVFAFFGGLMAMQAVAFATNSPNAWKLWWLALLWGAVMLALERIILQITEGPPWALALALIPRVVVSILVAVNIAGVGVMALYKGEIQGFLSDKQTRNLALAHRQVERIYASQLYDAKQEITRLKANERKVEDRIAREDLRTAQSRDVDGTCAERCMYYGTLAEDDRQLLATMHERNVGRFAGLRAKLKRLRRERRAAFANRRTAIKRENGFAAHEDALAQIKERHPAVNNRATLLGWLLVALDLTALTAKIVRVVTVKDGAYETNLRGRRASERLTGKRRLEDARTDESRIQDEGRATRRRTKARVDGFESSADTFEDSGSYGAPIEGYSLTAFTGGMTDWEREATTVPPAVRRVGLIGLGLIGMTLVIAVLSSTPLGALLIVTAAAVFGGWLLASTRGFQRAPGWALRAIFLTFAAGLVLPLLVLALSL